MPIIIVETAEEAFNSIVPIVKVSLAGNPTLIGTGFFITTTGVIVTAKHVILDNINGDGRDIGGIGVLCPYGPAAGVYRSLKRSHWHPTADIAISETAQYQTAAGKPLLAQPLALSVLPQLPDEPISSQFFHASALVPDKTIENEKFNPLREWRLSLEIGFLSAAPSTPETNSHIVNLSWSSRITRGNLTRYYPSGRDTVMLPFAVFESNLPIYAGASGGPVFNSSGQVIALNCSRIEGADVSYHTDITNILELIVENTCAEGDSAPRSRSIRELAEKRFVSIAGI